MKWLRFGVLLFILGDVAWLLIELVLLLVDKLRRTVPPLPTKRYVLWQGYDAPPTISRAPCRAAWRRLS